jgi:hypothetical protein
MQSINKMKKANLKLLLILLLYSIGLKAQKHVEIKKDTLYYLIDTIKTQKLDRMLDIKHADTYINYNTHCPCWNGGFELSFNYPFQWKFEDNIPLKYKPVYITKKELKKIKLISLSNLIKAACSYQDAFNNFHVLYFIEHLPNGKYDIKQVRCRAALVIEE